MWALLSQSTFKLSIVNRSGRRYVNSVNLKKSAVIDGSTCACAEGSRDIAATVGRGLSRQCGFWFRHVTGQESSKCLDCCKFVLIVFIGLLLFAMEIDVVENGAKGKRFFCTFKECAASFSRKFRLDRHLRSHRGEVRFGWFECCHILIVCLFRFCQRPFVCDIDGCEKAFTCASYLNKHVRRPHGDKAMSKSGVDGDIAKTRPKREKRHNCEHCLKEFKSKYLLKTHLAQHNGDKPFKCDQCGLAFALRSRLIRHLKIHQGYKCDRDSCNFVAEKWSVLRKHVATDHKTIHRCEDCDKILSSKFFLRAHIKAHNFRCQIDDCTKVFTRKTHLTNHINNDHSGPLLPCPHPGCDKNFHCDIVLAQHTLSHLNLNNKVRLRHQTVY